MLEPVMLKMKQFEQYLNQLRNKKAKKLYLQTSSKIDKKILNVNEAAQGFVTNSCRKKKERKKL